MIQSRLNINARLLTIFISVMICFIHGQTFAQNPVAVLENIAWNFNGTKLAAGYNTGLVQIIDNSNQQVLKTYQVSQANVDLEWSPTNANLLAISGGDGNSITFNLQVVNVSNDQLVMNVSGSNDEGDTIAAIAWSPDGVKLAGVADFVADTISYRRVKVWDVVTAQVVKNFLYKSDPITSIDVSPNGNQIVTGAIDKSITVWDANTGNISNTISGSFGAVYSIAYSFDGTKLASGGGGPDKVIHIWNTSSWQEIIALSGYSAYEIAWSPDGSRIAAAGSSNVLPVWQISTGQILTTISSNGPITAVAWSPNGNQLAYGGVGTTIQIVVAPQLPTSTPTPPPTSNGSGLLGQYYDNSDLTSRKLNRVDAIVDFNWGTGSPHASITSDTFSARWTGQVVPQYSQTYTFYTQSDDGVRLWVNNQQIINNWTNHSSTENSGTIALTAGVRYAIRMEYYENINGAIARLSWSSTSQSKQVIPTNRLLPNGRIAFQSFRDGNDEIYLMNGDGTNLMNFTANSSADQFPAIVPGTETLIFASTRIGNAEIFTIPLAGGTPTNLTNHGSYDHYASQAHDGRIVFASTRSAGGNFDLWTMNANGTGLTQLTSTAGAERNSNWSPDGQWIVYDVEVSGVYDLWKIPSTGGTAVRLTQNVGNNSDPSWSPDGTTIVFKTTRDTGHAIYLMNADGSNQRPFKTGGLNGFNPTWSPDGTYITYQAFPTSQPDIYSIPLGGTTSTQLTNNAAADQAASWGAQ